MGDAARNAEALSYFVANAMLEGQEDITSRTKIIGNPKKAMSNEGGHIFRPQLLLHRELVRWQMAKACIVHLYHTQL